MKNFGEPAAREGGAANTAILMCTKDGAEYLLDQLQSVLKQNSSWTLYVSDDGSTDETWKILENFVSGREQRVFIRKGPRKGLVANFLSLATDPAIESEFFAFSDQDDVWPADKLKRAVDWLSRVPRSIPALYCGRTELISATGRVYGVSPRFTRPPAFCNALVQNLAGGNTMVFNRATKRLLEATGPVNVTAYDWWLYLLVSGVGGAIYYDSRPVLKYRQHGANAIGSNRGWRARFRRIGMMFQGRFQTWNDMNLAALDAVALPFMTAENRKRMEWFARAKTSSLLRRIYYFKMSGVYRQTVLGNLGLLFGAIIGRI